MRRHSDVSVGETFGRLSIIGNAVQRKTINGSEYWFPCLCECGIPKYVIWTKLNSGDIKSCGCKAGGKQHGFRRTRLYSIWSNMKQRCDNPNNNAFDNYGGRGISYAKDWSKFMPFKEWAESNGYSDDLSIDRIDVNGNYEPANCRWVPFSEQSKNRRSTVLVSYEGETKSLKEWSDDPRCVVGYHTLYHRFTHGKSLEEAMTLPAQANPFPKKTDRVSL